MTRKPAAASVATLLASPATPPPAAPPAAPPAKSADVAPSVPKLTAKQIAEIKAVTDKLGARTDTNFADPAVEKDFETYLRYMSPNVFSQTDPAPFIVFWQLHRKQIMGVFADNNAKPDWEKIADGTYIAYLNAFVALSKDPSKLKAALEKAAGNPNAQEIAPSSFGLVTSVGVAFGVGVMTSIATGWIKDGLLASFNTLGKDMINSWAVRPFAKSSLKLRNLVYSEKRLARIRAEIDAAIADVAEALKPFKRGNREQMSLAQAKEAYDKLKKTMLALGEVYGKLPELSRKAHDGFVEMLVMRPEQVSNLVTTSTASATGERTAARSILTLLGQRNPAEAAQFQDLAMEMRSLVHYRMANDPLPDNEFAVYKSNVLALREHMIKLGAPEAETMDLVEHYKREYVFMRQSASLLAAQMFHSSGANDLAESLDKSYGKFMTANANNYFRKSMGDMVEAILDDIHATLLKTNNTVSDDRTRKTLEAFDNRPANENVVSLAEREMASNERSKTTIKEEVARLLRVSGKR